MHGHRLEATQEVLEDHAESANEVTWVENRSSRPDKVAAFPGKPVVTSPSAQAASYEFARYDCMIVAGHMLSTDACPSSGPDWRTQTMRQAMHDLV